MHALLALLEKKGLILKSEAEGLAKYLTHAVQSQDYEQVKLEVDKLIEVETPVVAKGLAEARAFTEGAVKTVHNRLDSLNTYNVTLPTTAAKQTAQVDADKAKAEDVTKADATQVEPAADGNGNDVTQAESL